MIDTKKIRERTRILVDHSDYATEDIYQLCGEVDWLRGRDNRIQAVADQLQKEVDQLQKMNDNQRVTIQELNQKLKQKITDQVAVLNEKYEEIQELRKELQWTPPPPTRTGQIIDEQEKKIAELKEELESAVQCCRSLSESADGEIAELKAELQRWRFSADHLKARQKLTKAIEDVINEWKILCCNVNGKPYPNVHRLKEILDVYGAK